MTAPAAAVCADGSLVYYPDSEPGITRRRMGRGFSYVAPDGTRIDRGPERDRLRALAVPPAYTQVWMSPLANGHLQATGYDDRDRKQYRYHPDWATARSETKYAGLSAFGRSLPAIRRRVRTDLGADAGDRVFALAAAVALIDRLGLRVGNEAYTRENGSHGALTLRKRHLRLDRDEIRLSFVGKGGRQVRRRLRDKALQRALGRARELPGATLLSWTDDDGESRSIGSSALNAYIAEAGGAEGFTAKTFRTWAGTLAAFDLVGGGEAPTIRAMTEAAADRLANTPAIARTSYVHPAVIGLAGEVPDLPAAIRLPGLRAGEGRLIAFLESAGHG